MNTHYSSPFGTLELERFPLFPSSKAQQNLQAWDGADTFLLEHVQSMKLAEPTRILIINDAFGALSCALQNHSLSVQSDSYLSMTAVKKNLRKNQIDVESIDFYASTDALKGKYDLVIMKIPKSLNLLKHQLFTLREHLSSEARVIAGAMAKNLSRNTRALFEEILGPTDQSLTQHKARILTCSPNPDDWHGSSSFQSRFRAYGCEWLCEANAFSEGRVDPGTQVFLQHLEQLPKSKSIIDLACGIGIMGILAGQACSAETVYFCDESYMAIASARHNASQLLSCEQHIEASHLIPESFPQVELVVCNPPFHQQQAISLDIAYAMFDQAKAQLLDGGELWIVANRHLNYHTRLKKLFGQCETLSRHSKFVVLRARKQSDN